MINWFDNLRVVRKLLVSFLAVLALTAFLGIFSILKLRDVNQTSTDMEINWMPSVKVTADMNTNTSDFRIAELQHINSPTKAEMDAREKDLNKVLATLKSNQAAYEKLISSGEEKKRYEEFKAQWASYLEQHTKVVDLSRFNRKKEALAVLRGKSQQEFDAACATLLELADLNMRGGQTASRLGDQLYASSRLWVIAVLCGSLLLGGILAIAISRRITGTLTQVMDRLAKLQSICITNLTSAVQAMEHGDLTAKIETGTDPLDIRTKDEFGDLAKTFNDMLDQVKATTGSFQTSQAALSDLVRRLQVSAGQVATASGTLASTAQQVGAATEEITATMQEVANASDQSARGAGEVAQGSANQARSVSEGAELIRQLAETVGSVARDAEMATRATADATEVATAGGQAVSQTVAGMHRIRHTVSESAEVIHILGEASGQIGTIIQTIDEIAAQTNLLALNAAIEAARAGEAGRGFAVVADEVRKLAERSGNATREISALIANIQTRTRQAVASMEAGTREVEAGTALAEQAGSALARIQEVVHTVTDRVQGICAAAEEMTAASDEVSKSIAEVAAVVEESSTATQEMSASAEEVSASVQTVAGTTQQTSASVEELVASSEELSTIARDLEAAVAQFRVEETGQTAGKPTLTLLKAA